MNTNMKTNCTICSNNCPKEALKCGRGKRFFSEIAIEEKAYSDNEHQKHRGSHPHEHRGSHLHEYGGHQHYDSDNLYDLMRGCGHFLHHKKGPNLGHGHGIGMSQNKIIKILATAEEMSQKDLQDLLQIQAGSLSELLTKLEEKALIIRYKNEDDKRCIMLRLTTQGKECQTQILNFSTDTLFDVLTDSEKEELKILLKKLKASWE